MSHGVASEIVARYALKGPEVELERTLPMAQGEELVVGLRVATTYGESLLSQARRGFLRLSNQRLCIVRHYGFIRDRIIVIPPGAITSVEGSGPTESVDVGFIGNSGAATITIVTWRMTSTWRHPVPPPFRTAFDSDVLPEPFRLLVEALDPGDEG